MALKLAIIQLAVTAKKSLNLQRCVELIKTASTNGAQLVCLPECFNSPYGIKYFPEYAETIPDGESSRMLAKAALENKIYLLGGSIPEQEGDKLYNTCTVYGPDGNLLTKYRKMHLFDINIPDKITFEESKVLSPGSSLSTFTISLPGQSSFKVGIGICYDIRFTELAQLYANLGCHLLVYPGAFNMTTGPLHWELLQRARAVDNQLYVAAPAPARDASASYVAWGHSSIINPWGEVLASAKSEETIIYADISLKVFDENRSQIPVTKQKRSDVYSTPCVIKN